MPSATRNLFIKRFLDFQKFLFKQKFFGGPGVILQKGDGVPNLRSPLRDICRRTVVRRGIPLLPDDRKKDCFFCTLFESISKKVGGRGQKI